jgi:hypothetical protein
LVLARYVSDLTEVLVTNTTGYGGDLSGHFYKQLSDTETKRVRMLSGYVGRESIATLHRVLRKNQQVAVELVVGMAAKEGLNQQTYDALMELHAELKSRRSPHFSRQGVYAFFSGPNGERARGMHAKAYLFDKTKTHQLIVGSSNFSSSGFSIAGNVEMNVIDSNDALVNDFVSFFEALHSNKLAVPIDLIDAFPIRGKAGKNRRTTTATLTKVKAPGEFKRHSYVDIDLARNIDRQSRSNLNCCFGKGRWSRATGVVKPRDWYEVELISPQDVTSNTNYPRGMFDVLTSDGFSFRGVTNGDNYKNFRSADDLKLLGLWLKGRLEDAGVLSDDPQEPVTSETFKEFGNSVIRMYRPSSKLVILHFPSNPAEL